jgi:hypothetical protein
LLCPGQVARPFRLSAGEFCFGLQRQCLVTRSFRLASGEFCARMLGLGIVAPVLGCGSLCVRPCSGVFGLVASPFGFGSLRGRAD